MFVFIFLPWSPLQNVEKKQNKKILQELSILVGVRAVPILMTSYESQTMRILIFKQTIPRKGNCISPGRSWSLGWRRSGGGWRWRHDWQKNRRMPRMKKTKSSCWRHPHHSSLLARLTSLLPPLRPSSYKSCSPSPAHNQIGHQHAWECNSNLCLL